MSDEKPNAAEIHRAVEFAKTCPPGINRTAAWAHELAEYRAALARDPAFALEAAEALLRDVGTDAVTINDERLAREQGFLTRIYYGPDGTECASGDTLAETYARLVAARKEHG